MKPFLHSKETICAALRERIFNRDGKGPLPDDSPVQKYWEDLNCLSVHLPSLHAGTLADSSSQVPKEAKYLPVTHDKIENNKLDLIAPQTKDNHQIADIITSQESQDVAIVHGVIDTSTVEFRCNKLKRTHCIEIGFSWGTMYKESDQHLWKEIDCDKWATEDTTEICKDGRPPPLVKEPPTVKKTTGDDENICIELQTTHLVVPGASWGYLNPEQQVLWSKLKCNELVKSDSVVHEIVEIVDNPPKDINKPPSGSKSTKAKTKNKSKKDDSFTDEGIN